MDDNKAICSRCGSTWTVNTEKRNRTDLRCFSCRMAKAYVIKYGKSKCIIWHGDYDRETLTIPMANDVPVMPGERSCGHSDCVNPEHLMS